MKGLTHLRKTVLVAVALLGLSIFPAAALGDQVNCILTVDGSNNWTGKGDLCPGAPFPASGTFNRTIFEGIQYRLPRFVIPGDVVLCEDVFCAPSDIVRFFLFPAQAEEYTPAGDGLDGPDDVLFPFPSLINPVFIREQVRNGACLSNEMSPQRVMYTAFSKDGRKSNTYTIVSDTPEPSSVLLLGSGLLIPPPSKLPINQVQSCPCDQTPDFEPDNGTLAATFLSANGNVYSVSTRDTAVWKWYVGANGVAQTTNRFGIGRADQPWLLAAPRDVF